MPEPDRDLRSGRSDRTRAACLEASFEILLTEGWDAVTQNRVAERAGVGRATVYRHWSDRESLLRDAIGSLSDGITLQIVRTGQVEADLRQLLALIARNLEGPGLGTLLGALMERSERDPLLHAIKVSILRESLGVLDAILEVGRSDGQLDVATDSSRAMAELIGPLLYRRFLSGEPLDADLVDEVVEHFLRAHRRDVVLAGSPGCARDGGRLRRRH